MKTISEITGNFSTPEVYSEHSQTSKMDLFAKTVKS